MTPEPGPAAETLGVPSAPVHHRLAPEPRHPEPRRTPIVAPSTDWWATSRRRVFLDAHTPDLTDPHQRGNVADRAFPLLSGVEPERDLERMAEAGVDSVVLFAKCQYGNAYYPSDVGRRHAALAGRDLFGEQVRAAHDRGIRVIAYFSNMWDTAAAGEHPEWAMVPSPARGSTGRWPTLCLLSDYRRRALDQVREIARRYPIDGLWSDILTAGPCVCHRCQAAFAAEHGRAIPERRDDPAWIDLIRFSQRLLREYLAEQRAVLREERPAAALIPNFYATTFVEAVTGLATDHLELADIGSSEGYTDWHDLGFPSFASEYIRAGVLDRPHEVLVSRFVHTWDFTLRSEAQLRFEAFTVAAHGATVSLDDQPYATGALEPEVYRRLAPVYRRVAERSPWLDGAVPERYAALYVPQSARELESLLGEPENPSAGEQSAQFPRSEPRSAPSDLDAAVSGTFRALVESHLPLTLVDARPASLNRLSAQRVLVLADVLTLAPHEVDAIAAFVRGGGGLVVTGEAGVRSDRGEPLAAQALESLLGLRFGPRGRYTYPYLGLRGELAERLGGWPLPHYGRIPALESVAPGATVLAERLDPLLETDPSTYWHNNQPAPAAGTGEPVIVERTVGAGRVIVSAARLGNNHARLGHAGYRDLLDLLVRRAAGGDPAVRVEGSHRGTELVVARLGDAIVAHLVSGHPVARLDLHGAQQPQAIDDIASISRLRLRVPASTTAAARVVDGVERSLAIVDGAVELRDLDDWETVVLRGGFPASG